MVAWGIRRPAIFFSSPGGLWVNLRPIPAIQKAHPTWLASVQEIKGAEWAEKWRIRSGMSSPFGISLNLPPPPQFSSACGDQGLIKQNGREPRKEEPRCRRANFHILVSAHTNTGAPMQARRCESGCVHGYYYTVLSFPKTILRPGILCSQHLGKYWGVLRNMVPLMNRQWIVLLFSGLQSSLGMQP